jgi:hypothetical protein
MLQSAISLSLLTATIAHAQITFEKPQAKLGVVKAVGAVEHRFPFVVKGAQQAKIVDIRPSCGCVRVSLPKTKFAPGEAGTIPLVIHVASQAEGKKRFELTLVVRDPSERTIVLTAEADLQSEVKVEPSNLVVQLHDGQTSTHRIVVRDRRPRPLKIIEAAVSNPNMKAKLAPPGVDKHERVVELTIGSGLKTGQHAERVEIRALTTENPAFPESIVLEIPIVIRRPSTYTLIPERLRIKRTDLLEGSVSRNVALIDRSGSSPEIRLETGDAKIAAVCRRESPATLKMKVTVQPGAQSTKARLIVNGQQAGELPIDITD